MARARPAKLHRAAGHIYFAKFQMMLARKALDRREVCGDGSMAARQLFTGQVLPLMNRLTAEGMQVG